MQPPLMILYFLPVRPVLLVIALIRIGAHDRLDHPWLIAASAV
jgi:hypothetical protein